MATGRKPVHLTMVGKSSSGRQAVWEAIRRQKEFTRLSLADEVKTETATIKTYVDGLLKAGFIESTGKKETSVKVSGNGKKYLRNSYRLVKDVGIKAPRVTRDGKIVTQGKGTEQMWRTMRMLKAFTADELAVMASTEEIQVKPQTAKSYLKHICKAGYITVISTRPKRYRFARWTGCQPPMIQRLKTVFDPNLRQIMWQEEAND